MPSWFKKVFSTGEGKAPEREKASEAPAATAAPKPSPQPAAPPPQPADDYAENRPKIRKVINAPVIVPEEEQSSYSEEIRIKARVDQDGFSCRFLVDRPIVEGMSAWFPAAEWAQDTSGLAEKLFEVDGVGTVLLHGTTVTIGRAEGNTRGWEDLAKEVGGVIREFLKSGEKPVVDELRESMPPEEEIRQKIQTVLDLEINPGIAAHSGVVSLERVEGNTVYITMGGGCQGCAASTITLRHGIHTAFRNAVPQVGAIYDETDHAAGTNPYFKELPAGMSA